MNTRYPYEYEQHESKRTKTGCLIIAVGLILFWGFVVWCFI